ncbi:MAG TPA: hypothetical protein VK210_10910, partial [Terriglobia bacterium]|nr:hypothetical protein [Terriglobia bacterium]
MPQHTRPIEYTVSFPAPQTQTVEIRMVIRGVDSASIDVALPVWRTGRYAVLNPAGTLNRVRAQRRSGAPLRISKLDKTTWRVLTEGQAEIEVH